MRRTRYLSFLVFDHDLRFENKLRHVDVIGAETDRISWLEKNLLYFTVFSNKR